MRFVSTRGDAIKASASRAILVGTPSDGGLFMPEWLPSFALGELNEKASLAGFAAALLKPFFVGDVLESDLRGICKKALNFPVPLVQPDPDRPGFYALELFHGPTGAFKDFGARFLMGCFDRMGNGDRPMTVLAATSGDTGGAVGCAAEDRRSVRAVILYPKARISPFQERQLTCWKKPVLALEIDGDFDDCQRLVKAALAEQKLRATRRLTSANSINIGRLLPQVAYIAQAALKVFVSTGQRPGFIVPTGNLGHGLATILARAMGIPMGPIVLATNANRTLKDWVGTGRYEPRPSVATLATAMDVGAPSNFERLMALPEETREVRVELVEDKKIEARIRADHEAFGYIWCPHSATATEAYARLSNGERAERPWIVSATAHPYKFREAIEPIIGCSIAAPPALARILDRSSHKASIAATLDALDHVLVHKADAAQFAGQ